MSKFEKENYGAYTIRPKINKILDEYLVPFEEAKIKNKKTDIKVDCPEHGSYFKKHRRIGFRMRH